MKKILILLLLGLGFSAAAQNSDIHWTATWSTAPEKIGSDNMPSKPLDGRSLRQIVHVSIGGGCLRLKLSNEFSDQALEIREVYIADPGEGWEIVRKTDRSLRFSGKKSVTVAPGEAVYSDPVNYDLKPLQRLSVTINYGDSTPQYATCHRGSRTTSYIIDGASKAATDFSAAETIDHWYNICSIEVPAPETQECIVVLGDSITDGNGTTTNKQNRWTDFLAEAYGGDVAVLNLGIGASCAVLSDSPACGSLRFDRDVLGQKGAKSVIVYYGVNDIGESTGDYEDVAEALINCYKDFISKAHAQGMKIYLATITPFGKSFYYSYFHEAARRTVNDWIRSCGEADGIIDFDAAVRDVDDRECMKAEYAKDFLHMNPDGYAFLGKYAHDCLERF